MTKGRTPARRDRSTLPHSRIPDAVYHVLAELTPYETKLWLALRCRAWRKPGSRRGVVRKTLRRIAKDIAMPWGTTQRAFNGLRSKGFAEWCGEGIRLLELDFTTALTTGFTTKDDRRIDSESGPTRATPGPTRARKWPHQGQEGQLVAFPSNGLNPGRDDLIETVRGARQARPRTVERSSQAQDLTTEDRAPLTPSGDGARLSRKPQKENNDVMTDDDDDLTVRDMPHDEAIELLRKIKARAMAAADEGTAKIQRDRDAQREREEKRKDELRQQARELEKGSETA